ncbi:hypothetical protein GF361_00785 [Candidatus Woesearchaeota archaeon]|nr:hypothetical protein [Candidatus Woesearchaeota archaeon]
MAKKGFTSRLKHNILMIGIAIIFALFVGYGIDTFYEAPEYEDFCNESERLRPVKLNQSDMEEFNAKQNQCWEQYDAAREPYNRNVFIITLVIGLAAVIAGSFFMKVESVSSGIMAGGVLTIIYGTLRYWGDMHKYLRFSVLTIVLIILIWIGYKKFRD